MFIYNILYTFGLYMCNINNIYCIFTFLLYIQYVYIIYNIIYKYITKISSNY